MLLFGTRQTKGNQDNSNGKRNAESELPPAIADISPSDSGDCCAHILPDMTESHPAVRFVLSIRCRKRMSSVPHMLMCDLKGKKFIFVCQPVGRRLVKERAAVIFNSLCVARAPGLCETGRA